MLANQRTILQQELNKGIKALKKMTPKATGKTRRSIKGKVTKAPKGWKAEIITADHWKFAAVTGRGPGKMPPINKIEDWIAVVGSDAGPFAVALVISEDGTKLFQKGGNKLTFDLIQSNIQKSTEKRLEEFYTSLVEGSIEKEIAGL